MAHAILWKLNSKKKIAQMMKYPRACTSNFLIALTQSKAMLGTTDGLPKFSPRRLFTILEEEILIASTVQPATPVAMFSNCYIRTVAMERRCEALSPVGNMGALGRARSDAMRGP